MNCSTDGDTLATTACRIEDLPPELRLHIMGFVDCAADVAAALMASRLFVGVSAVDMAIAEGATYTGRLLEAGAPLDVVRRTLAARGRPLGRGFIESAVRGGRMDVLHIICETVKVDIRKSYYDPRQHDRDGDYESRRAQDDAKQSAHCHNSGGCRHSPCDGGGDNDDGDNRVRDEDMDQEQKEAQEGGDHHDQDTDDDDDYSDDEYASDCDEDDYGDAMLYRALCTAIDLGRADALRYLVSRPIMGSGGSKFLNQRAMVRAARAGHANIVALMHDRDTGSRYRDSDFPCACNRRVGRAAWKAPTLDVVFWLRDYQCRGYVPPTVDDVGHMIERGNAASLRRVLVETEIVADLDYRGLARSIAVAASKGHVDVLRLLIKNDLCPRPDIMVIGASRGGNTNMLSWIFYSDDIPFEQDHREPTLPLMRAAAFAAATNNQPSALSWILKHCPAVADLALLCASIAAGSIEMVRIVDMLLPASFDWQRMMARAIRANSFDIVRFLVEEKGATIDPLDVAGGNDALSDQLIDYLSSICARGDLQLAFDMCLVDDDSCLVIDDDFGQSSYTARLYSRIGGLCTRIRDAAFGERCDCAECAAPNNPTLTAAAVDRQV